MARQRFIWPELWKDPVFGKLTPTEQVMFIGLFSIADDEGRLLADAAFLRAELFAYKDYTTSKVRGIRDSVCSKLKNVHLYEVDEQEFIALLKWTDYQKPKYPKPSKIPPPFPQASPNVPPELKDEVKTPDPWVGQGRAGLDGDGQGLPAEEALVDVRTAVERHFGLPISSEKLQELGRILSAVRDTDDDSFRVLQDVARNLSLGSLVRVRESCEKKRPRPGVGYAVNALKSEAQEAAA